MKIKAVFMFVMAFLMISIMTACAVSPAVAQKLVGVPDELKVLVSTLLTAGLTWLLIQLGGLLKIDLTGYVAPLLAVVSPILITLIEDWLGLIPSVYDDLVLAIIHVIVVGIGSLGALLILRQKTKATLLGG